MEISIRKWLILSTAFWPLVCPKDIPLTLGGIFPMSGSWAGGVACKPAVMMALEMVNNRPDILPRYHLNMQYNDSQCMPGLGTKVLYQLLYDKPTKIMVLSGCSSVSTFVAQAANMWNLIVLAYGASSPALSNRERFPMFFRTHPSATVHNPTRVKLFKHFKWNRIATIQETQELFTSTIEDLEKRVKEAGIDIAVRQSFLTDPTNAVRNLKRQDARVIVGVFYEDMARRVFCQAYKEKLYGKKYVWLIIGWYPDNWYRTRDDRHNCTVEQLEEALEGHLTTEAVILHQENTTTDVGMMPQEFTQRLNKELNTSDPSLITGYPEAPLAYDAVWALAFALNKTANKLAEKGMSLEQFNYSNKEIAQEIYSAMNSTKFLGISGNVAFSSQGDRIARTQIEQMINGTYHKLGYYDSLADNFTWFGTDRWIGGKPPLDHTHVIDHLRVVSKTLYFSMCALAIVGILAGAFCLIFNYRNRQRRCVAFSQPNINSLTVLGCMSCLACIFLLGLDGKFVSPDVYPLVCQIRAWVLSLGFTLSYGSMFSKIWTVHQLTTSRKKDRKGVQIWELYTVLAVLLVLDVGVLSAWQVLDPLKRELEVFAQEDPTDTEEDIQLRPQLEHCNSENLSVWLGVLFGYKGILLIFGIFLAYETRSVKLKQVNDSRFVGMSIYNVVVLCVITAPISLIIGNQQDATFAFVSLAIILCSFLSLGLIFVPKMMELYKHPQRDGQEVRSLTDSLVSREEEERHLRMVSENEQLKKQIAEMEERVKDLNVRLQKKMQQHSLMTSMSGTGTAPDETVPLLSNTSIHANAITATTTVIVKPASASQDGDLLSEHGTRYQLDDGIIPVDGNSDSGLASWSLTKSSKTSASDSEPFC
ncbi:gamma-aminobutyric acid type B receptor subunit 1-like [Pomacea canaliculata]|uniref:gamma-aminobutyric acid type B receptor subunit 1-like n=1 Tax=Pomacea canaliculata TaxID=400727 RepID=UPI000D73F60B|nr:gamma-aminobutyric acid type B receptor subunit 1-like [Pomacea canaliculata]XP_025112676.1 gamma-aminobutyric acid type B receptor subunit 1-like [Pomacea canaliculata]XP_025112677.1 gamma-aminobutyric acid type B receptor subunit 1-like [Pomacea canaliculata]